MIKKIMTFWVFCNGKNTLYYIIDFCGLVDLDAWWAKISIKC